MAEEFEWHYHEPFGYLDSGAPLGSSNYTTLLIIHGSIWHAPVFCKLFPLALASNTRIIAINRREFPHSKPLDSSDTELLTRPGISIGAQDNEDAIDGFRIFMKDRAMEVVDFISWLVDGGVVKTKKLASTDGSNNEKKVEGGISVITWSSGGRIILSILANLASFPPELTKKLEPYIRSLVLYDCAGTVVFGHPPHPKRYNPTSDSSLTPKERVEKFLLWVSGYYHHHSLSLPDSELKKIRSEDLDLEFIALLASPVPSVHRMNEEELARSTDQNVANAHDKAEFVVWQRATDLGFSALEQRDAFFNPSAAQYPEDKDSDNGHQTTKILGKQEVWPNIPTYVLWCDMSTAETAYGAILLEKDVDEARAEGKWVRDIRFVRFRGVNHYAHWDEPERTFNLFLHLY